MKKKYCLLTNDVEITSIWQNILREETGLKVYREGMPMLLELYKKYEIKTTFFFTGYIAKLIPDVVKMIIPYSHEVGSHGMSHLPENSFDIMPFKKQKEHLIESKKILEDISGSPVVSFRAPALRVNRNTSVALNESGYLIDSSIASQRFDFFMSFGGRNKMKWLFAPRLPYRTSKISLFKKGIGNIIEIPLSAAFFPYVGTTMRIFPGCTSFLRRMIDMETQNTGKPVVFNIHPNEMIDESEEIRKIGRRSNNFFIYFIKDYLRSNLKKKNLGIKAFHLYEQQIAFFKKRNYQFTSLKEYCEKELIRL